MTKKILIQRCKDPAKWYASLVGHVAPFVRMTLDGYQSREPAGFINFVDPMDGDLIDTERPDYWTATHYDQDTKRYLVR